MEHILLNYLANAAWQVPLLAVAAWFFIRLGRFAPQTQHCIWLAVLGLAVGLPLRGARADLPSAASTPCIACNLPPMALLGGKSDPPVQAVHYSGAAGPRWLEEFSTLPAPRLRLSETATDWLAGFYFATFFIGLFRTMRAWRGARRLAMGSRATVLQPQWRTMFEDAGRRLGTTLPRLRKSADVRSPVIVGALDPVLLLPDDFDNHSPDEALAAFYHELAHVRRQDYLVNLICQIAVLPVVWHPAAYELQQRIRRTREMVCDAIAAQQMQSEIGYAKCLLTMARRTLGQRDLAGAAQAIGLFGNNELEERIMRLMQERSPMTGRTKLARVASGATVMVAAIAMAVLFHVTPTLAQSTDKVVPAPAQSTTIPDRAATPAPEAAPTPVTNPRPPVPPVSPLAPISPVAPVPPIPPVAPNPAEAKPSVRRTKIPLHRRKTADQKQFVLDLGGNHALTAEQRAHLQKEMDAMGQRIAAATKQLDGPEFQRQMADLMKQQDELKSLDLAKIQQQVDAATAKIDSPEFKRQMEKLQKQMENGQIQRSMVEMRKQMKAAEAQTGSAETK